MTTLAIPGSSDESALQKEGKLFQELFVRLGNAMLNSIFDLRPEKAARRMQNLLIAFIVIWYLITLRYYPAVLWAQHLREIFLFIFNPAFAQGYEGNPFIKFAIFAWNAFTDPHVFQYFPIFLASFFIALQSAAIYLSDVFELEDVSVARSFACRRFLSARWSMSRKLIISDGQCWL